MHLPRAMMCIPLAIALLWVVVVQERDCGRALSDYYVIESNTRVTLPPLLHPLPSPPLKVCSVTADWLVD